MLLTYLSLIASAIALSVVGLSVVATVILAIALGLCCFAKDR